MRVRTTLTVVMLLLSLTGCVSFGQVKPWEKGNLANPSMGFATDVLGARFEQHVYGSRENSSGGYGVGGGGCGCN